VSPVYNPLNLPGRNFMKNKSLQVKHIEQKDNYTFTILWNDEIVKEYRLNELQIRCPCANCVDEVTGERIANASPVNENVKAKKLTSVGKYALRIDFTSGCSHGIYTFDMLREEL
jgi:DUF971 family protein